MGKHLVLVGGGHAHLTVLAHLGRYVGRGHRATLISPCHYHYYSGMGPGMLSGLYEPRQVRFNIQRMVQERGGQFIEARVTSVDPAAQKFYLDNDTQVSYDIASFNIGSVVPTAELAATDEHIFAVKPILNLYKARNLILSHSAKGTTRVLVAGGGPAGIEIAANAWKLLIENGATPAVTLVAGNRILRGVPARARHLAVASLTSRRIAIFEGIRVHSFANRFATLTDGRSIPFDFAFVAVGIRPPAMFRESGIPVGEDGGMSVNGYLQSTAHPQLFGGGDCISVEGHTLAKVGVHAVRQNPILQHNIEAALDGGEMKRFAPNPNYMLIMNMGDGRGIMWKKSLVLNGGLAFLLKDFIDRRFMKRFQVSGELKDFST
ncbi:MAG: NAD(P)/FAD-dependent oxidoreductase [Syntrophobacteraceae bacterium]